jgi:hypothetical protein
MPVTFVRTTDRPRLFDDRPSPRARRPARRTDRDRAPSRPEAATPSFDFASPASPPAEPEARPPEPTPAEHGERVADAPHPTPAEHGDHDARAPQPTPAEHGEPEARALQPAPAKPEVEPDGSAALEPATPGFDLAPADADHAPHGHEPTSSGATRDAHTLDHLISGVWDELSAHRTVSCPVCHGQMAPRYGSAALPVGGRCRRCGSTLG